MDVSVTAGLWSPAPASAGLGPFGREVETVRSARRRAAVAALVGAMDEL